MSTIEQAIPKHKHGVQKRFGAARKFRSQEDAQRCYDQARSRLLDINHWHELSMLGDGAARLMDAGLRPQYRKAKQGDYVRLGLPAPDNRDGEGYDWVRIAKLLCSAGQWKEQCLLTLQPCPIPGGTHTAHFFDTASTSNFLVTRKGRLVTADYYGQNEIPNTDTAGLRDTLRNLTVAAGAMLGFSGAMWQPMMQALLMDGTQFREQREKSSRKAL